MPSALVSRLRSGLSSFIELELVYLMVAGGLIVLSGMGDPGPGAAAPWFVQFAPLSGFVLVVPSVIAFQLVRDREARSRSAAKSLFLVVIVMFGVAFWLGAVSPLGPVFAQVALVSAVPLVVGAFLLMIPAATSSARD